MMKKSVFDHLGNEYKSIKEMREHYDISEGLWDNRKRKGWSLEQILTTPIKKKGSLLQTYIGMEFPQKCGYIATVIKADSQLNCTVIFNDENKTVRTNLNISNIRSGRVSLIPKDNIPQVCIGMRKVMNCGDEAEIIDIISAHDITIKWTKDGKISEHKYATDFIKGLIKYPISFVGISMKQECGLKGTIIEEYPKSKCKVLWEDNVESIVRKNAFTLGKVSHPNLNKKKICNFHNFTANYRFTEDDNTYWKCNCNKCGLEDILTPQQMMEHNKTHE